MIIGVHCQSSGSPKYSSIVAYDGENLSGVSNKIKGDLAQYNGGSSISTNRELTFRAKSNQTTIAFGFAVLSNGDKLCGVKRIVDKI